MEVWHDKDKKILCGYVQELVLYMKTSRHDQENAYGYVFCNMMAIFCDPNMLT